MADRLNTHDLGYCCRYASGQTCVGCGDAENGIDLEVVGLRERVEALERALGDLLVGKYGAEEAARKLLEGK